MSAIGSYAVISRNDYSTCLQLARNIGTETSGKWIFKKSQVVGINEFLTHWQKSVIEEIDFNYSGYVLGNYLDAQDTVNGPGLYDEQSEPAILLSKVFTAAFPFESVLAFPAMTNEKLKEFCQDEYGEDDSNAAVEAIQAADRFYREGMERISAEKMVVFIIR